VIGKVLGQLNAEDLFHDVTKTMREMHSWGRGWMRSAVGPRWFSQVLPCVKTSWSAVEAIMNTWPEQYWEEWSAFAPYQETKCDRSIIFFVCACVVADLAEVAHYDVFGITLPGMEAAQAIRAWWDKEIEGVFGEGKYDDNNADLHYGPPGEYWIIEESGNAYQGSYHLSEGVAPTTVAFYFYGTRIGIIYHQVDMQAQCLVTFDAGAAEVFSQNDEQELWQVEWLSKVVTYGLHKVEITRTGAEGPVNVDGIVVYGKG
jgi:hypothetical protein